MVKLETINTARWVVCVGKCSTLFSVPLPLQEHLWSDTPDTWTLTMPSRTPLPNCVENNPIPDAPPSRRVPLTPSVQTGASQRNNSQQIHGFSSRASRKECSLIDTLIVAQWDPRQNSNPQHYKIIHVCCLKPPNLQSFVTAAVRN